MMNSKEYDRLVVKLTLKLLLFVFILLLASIYFSTLPISFEKVLLVTAVTTVIGIVLFLTLRKDFFLYDTILNNKLVDSNFYKNIISDSFSAFLITDGDGIMYYNEAAKKLLNATSEVLETSAVLDLIADKDRSKLDDVLTASTDTNNLILKINTTANNRDRYANFSVQKHVCRAKDVFIISFYDITDSYKTDLTNIENLSIYKAALDNLPSSISVFDSRGKIVYRNKTAQQDSVISQEKTFANIIEYDTNRSILNTAFHTANEGYSYNTEVFYNDSWSKIMMLPISLSQNSKYVEYVIDNISTYKKNINDLEYQNLILSLAFDNSSVPKIFWNKEGAFIRANQKFHESFGFAMTMDFSEMMLNFSINKVGEHNLIKEIIFNPYEPNKKMVFAKDTIALGLKKYSDMALSLETFDVVICISTNAPILENNYRNREQEINTDTGTAINNVWYRNLVYPLIDKNDNLQGICSEYYNVSDYYTLTQDYNITKLWLEAISYNFYFGIIFIVNENKQIVFIGGDDFIKKRFKTTGYNLTSNVNNYLDILQVQEFYDLQEHVDSALQGGNSQITAKILDNTYTFYFSPIKSVDVKNQYCLGVGVNITDRENFEKQIVSQKNYHEKIFSASTIPSIILDAAGKFVNANMKYYELIGADWEQIFNTDIYDKVSWISQDIIIENFERTLQGEATQFEIVDKQTFILDDDINDTEVYYFTLICKCYPVIDSDGNVESVIISFIDVSDTRMLLENIKKSNAINNIVTSNYPNGILIILNKDMRFILFEGAEEIELIQMNGVKVLGKNLQEVDSPVINIIKPYVVKAANSKQKINFDFSSEVKYIENHNNKTFNIFYEANVIPILDGEQEIEYVFVCLNNITNRKNLEEKILEFNAKLENEVSARTKELQEQAYNLEAYVAELQATQSKLVQVQNELASNLNKEIELNQMKTQFISLMSHEFRTPITVIQTCAYLLETYFSMQQKDKFDNTLHKLLIAIDTTTKLLDNILFLDEIKEHSVMFSKIDIIAFIKYVVEEVSTDLEAKQSITVNTNVESLILLTDEKLIRKTINNLLANAIKYSPATSQITIDINDATSELNIIIADTGPGIADDVVTKIFETFVRSMTVTNISGAGLGLSIVKNCVDLLKGTIRFETKKNQGTTFFLSFPKLEERDIFPIY